MGFASKKITNISSFGMLSTKTECDYLNGWIKKTVTYAKISPKMVNPRDIAGEREEEEEVCKPEFSVFDAIMFCAIVCLLIS